MAHFFSSYQIRRGSSEHSSERSRQMGGIGESRDMRGFSSSCSIHELIRRPLQAEPKNIGTYRDSHRLCEHVHKPRWRKARDFGQGFERKVLSPTQVFTQVFENPPDARVNLYCATTIQQFLAHP